MAIFTVSLEESMDASDIDKNPLWESMSVLDETNANQSLAHKSLSEATSLLDEVIMNWTNSTVHTQNVGEYLWAVDTVSGILLGNIYTENMTEAITVLEEVGKDFSVTRERIRQIEVKALRKLRHPSRSKKLQTFFDKEFDLPSDNHDFD